MVPNVSGSSKVIASVIKNYVPLLERGGRLLINRFEKKTNLPKREDLEFHVHENPDAPDNSSKLPTLEIIKR